MTDSSVDSGTTSPGLTVAAADTLSVYQGGSIVDTTIDGFVADSGDAVASLIYSGGTQNVNGTAENTVIYDGGQQDVVGTAQDTTISSGGSEYVEGVSINATISSGGGQYEDSGGVASGSVVLAGGYQGVGDNQELNGTVSTGSAVDTQVEGLQYIVAGSVATNTTVLDGGIELLGVDSNMVEVAPDSTVGTVVSSGGTEIVGGVSTSGIVTETVNGQIVYTVSGDTTSQVTSYGPGAAQFAGYSVTLVEDGGEVYRTARNAGGTQVGATHSQAGLIDQLAVASNTTVLSGGTFAFEGGAASDLHVESGGIELVGGEATLPNNTVFAASLVQIEGNTVGDGVKEIVLDHGQDLAGQILSGGEQSVTADGYASGTVISLGGTQVLSGGEVQTATIQKGGEQIVSSGGIAVSSIIQSGGTLNVLNSGSAFDPTGNENATIFVQSGGSLIRATVMSSPALDNANGGPPDGGIYVDLGGAIVDTVLSEGSDAEIHGLAGRTKVLGIADINNVGAFTTFAVKSGGYADQTTVSGYHAQAEIYQDGSFVSGTLQHEGELFNSGGAIDNLTISAGGNAHNDAGTITNTFISSGGTLFGSGGLDDLTTIFSSGTDEVFGSATQTLVLAGGELDVYKGGIAASSTLSAGGTEFVSSGGMAVATAVSSNGLLQIQAYGSATRANVGSGGSLGILANGSSTQALIKTGGVELVFTGGLADQTTVQTGAEENVSGTSTDATIMSGGIETIFTGGVTSQTVVESGGIDNVLSGGQVMSNQILDGGIETVAADAKATKTVIDQGGGQFIANGGQAIGTSVDGLQIVSAGGKASASDVIGTLIVYGSATNASAGNEGEVKVSGGGVTSATQVQAGGFEIVLSGGTASGTTISAGGAQGVSAGGIAADATILVGGLERVHRGGTSIRALVFGTLINENGDPTISATIESGGVQVVEFGASAQDTTVSSGGYLLVLPGAIATNATVQSGGNVVSSGVVIDHSGGGVQTYAGTVSGTMLGAGDTEYVLQSGIASATVVGAGASLTVEDGGSAVSTDVQSGGSLVLQSGGSITATTLEAGGTLDLTAFAYADSGTVTSGSGGYAISQGGQTTALGLAGSYTGEYFHLAADSFGGTTLSVDGTPCYCRGTFVLTDRGEIAVEDLAIGDGLVTVSGEVRPIRWIGQRSYSGRFAASNPEMLPVIIRKAALGQGLPRRDLWVSPLHAMFLDGVLVPANALLNGDTIVQATEVETVAYFHLELDSHDVILAEGAASETFIDDDSRGMFHNAAEWRALYPMATRQPARYCAPRVEGGALLDAIRRRLAPKATVMADPGGLQGHLDEARPDLLRGWARNPDAPDQPVRLRLVADGVTLAEQEACEYRADLANAGIGDGHYGFTFVISGGLPSDRSPVIQVMRSADGRELVNSPWIVGGEARSAGAN